MCAFVCVWGGGGAGGRRVNFTVIHLKTIITL